MPLVGLTAYQCLVEKGRLAKGQTVLVHAGSGGVGAFAIQLAKHVGATVVTTCSAKNAAFVRELGADRVDRLHEGVVRGRRVTTSTSSSIASARAPTRETCASSKRGGRISNITIDVTRHVERYGPFFSLFTLAWTMRRRSTSRRGCASASPSSRREAIATARSSRRSPTLVEAGAIRPTIDRVLPLAEAAEAHRLSETNRARGKIVLRVE